MVCSSLFTKRWFDEVVEFLAQKVRHGFGDVGKIVFEYETRMVCVRGGWQFQNSNLITDIGWCLLTKVIVFTLFRKHCCASRDFDWRKSQNVKEESVYLIHHLVYSEWGEGLFENLIYATPIPCIFHSNFCYKWICFQLLRLFFLI